MSGTLRPSTLNPLIFLYFLGEFKGRKGYNFGLIVQGPKTEVAAFENWCLVTLHRDFRLASRTTSGQWTEDPLVSIRINFRDRGKYALVKLQWS
jgi:hypothetical protein